MKTAGKGRSAEETENAIYLICSPVFKGTLTKSFLVFIIADRKSRCCLDTDSATVLAETRQLSSEALPGVLYRRKITVVKKCAE
jgi:hypothetical protein